MQTKTSISRIAIQHLLVMSAAIISGIILSQNGIIIPEKLKLLSFLLICANLHFSPTKNRKNLILLQLAYCLLLLTYSNQLAVEYQGKEESIYAICAFLEH